MPPSAVPGLPGCSRKTGWQLAQRAWEESGVVWEESGVAWDDTPAPDESQRGTGPWPVQVPSGEPRPAPLAPAPAAPALVPQEHGEQREEPPPPRRIRRASTAWTDSLRSTPEPPASPLVPSAFAPASPFAPAPAFGAHSGFRSPPLSAPVAAPLGEPEELFRAWQGSVDKAAGRRTPWTARRPGRPEGRRSRGWRVAKIGVPAAVIVTVGAGALMMLTGQANEMLAERASSGALSSGKPASGPVASRQTSAWPTSAAPGGGGLTLAGYPAEHGTAGVAALWSAGGTTVAVGSADGHPAVWRHAADGNWSLVSTAVLEGTAGKLTSVAQGPAGWIAVGSVSDHGTAEPVVYASADASSWERVTTLSAVAGRGARFLGVAAGPGGYLVTGAQGTGKQASVALWWSSDLRNWVNGEAGGPPGSYAAAAVATVGGFVAVGSENHCHTLWISPDGQHWTVDDIVKPPGATTGTLTSVAAGQGVQADRFVAAGVVTTGAGDLPVVVTAANDGTHVSQTVLGSLDGPAAVTAVTATAGGFVAVGAAGPDNAQRPVTWTSQEGRIWTPAAALKTAGGSEITALTATSAGTTLTAAAERGAAPALLTFQAPG